MIMQDQQTMNALSECWEQAEQAVQDVVKQKYYGVGEETLTLLFARELEVFVEHANKIKLFERAFLRDLEEAFPEAANNYELAHIAGRLIAKVTFHNKRREGKTGGDMGLIIAWPVVRTPYYNNESTQCLVIDESQRGILSQAKLYGPGKSFPTLKKTILRERLAYSALLIYEYEDPDYRILKPFKWQSCKEAKWNAVTAWVRKQAFPTQ